MSTKILSEDGFGLFLEDGASYILQEATESTAGGFLLLESAFALLQEDGTSRLLLESGSSISSLASYPDPFAATSKYLGS